MNCPDSPEQSFVIVKNPFAKNPIPKGLFKGVKTYKLNSVEAHQVHRNELLALLLKLQVQDETNEQEFENTDSSKPAELLQNIPNPFSNKTTIQFKISDVDVNFSELSVFDYSGKVIMQFPVQAMKNTIGKVELNLEDIPNGIYYYSLFINGKRVDTKKMSVIN